MVPAEPSDVVQAEIERIHAFISAWFRGEVAKTRELYATELLDRMAPGFANIQPAGTLLSRDDLAEGLFAGHGTNPAFHISISDVAVRHVSDDGHWVLATYIEHQTGAINTTPTDNDRRSTVLFRLDPAGGRPTWLHIHETAL